jgi:hypothetical protein
MVESICGQGFAYAREAKEDWQNELVKTRKKGYMKNSRVRRLGLNQFHAIYLALYIERNARPCTRRHDAWPLVHAKA